MRALLLCALPFHRWVLESVGFMLRVQGWSVDVVVHEPTHEHDWMHNNLAKGSKLRNRIEAVEPDLVLVADYPYGPIREIVRAPIVAVRHSLAARGNTWMKEQLDADFILTWSEWDDNEFVRRHGEGVRSKLIRTGCVWAEGMEHDSRNAHQRTVAWCPTWNSSFSCRNAVERALLDLANHNDWRVIVRPHPATFWREPKWVELLQRQNQWLIDDPRTSATSLLTEAHVLVTDVSGIGLTALAVRDADLPVVWIDPAQEHLNGSDQYDATGPEWVFRSEVGARCREGVGLYGAIVDAADLDLFASRRKLIRDTLLESERTTRNACQTAAIKLTSAIGTTARTGTTASAG
jgi:hypothetical protein